MRVLHVRSSYADNGPGTQPVAIGGELRKRGHEVLYAGSDGVMVHTILERGFTFIEIPELAVNRRGPVSVVSAIRKLADIIASFHIDVVHAHNAAAAYCAYMGSLWARRKVRLVHSVRGLELRSAYAWRNWIYRLYPADMLAVSEFTRRELLRVGADPRRITVTYNGVDLERFRVRLDRGRQGSGEDGRLVIGHVGAFSGWKGQDVLVRAVHELGCRGNDVGLLLVGDGPSRGECEALAGRLGVEGIVEFPGFRRDIPECLARMDVYCQPSVRGEMFPNSILEAMACGLPWVGSDISGLAELSGNGTTGLLCEPGNLAELVERLEALVRAPSMRLSMGRSARAEVEQKFSLSRVVDRIEAAYQGALAV